MDEVVAEYIRRTVLKIPRDEILAVLRQWGFLSDTQLGAINLRQTKESISREVVRLCEVSLPLGAARQRPAGRLLDRQWLKWILFGRNLTLSNRL